jgi:hypothetical protein
MSDEQYVEALVNGHATIEYRSERVLVAEVKRLRLVVAAQQEAISNLIEEKNASVRGMYNAQQNVSDEAALRLKMNMVDDQLQAALLEGGNKDCEIGRLLSENEQLRKDVNQQMEDFEGATGRMEAEINALTQTMTACNEVAAKYKTELDWFRRRESEHVERLLRKNADDARFAALLDWEESNPKPGAGE